jgi:hypothetical protein
VRLNSVLRLPFLSGSVRVICLLSLSYTLCRAPLGGGTHHGVSHIVPPRVAHGAGGCSIPLQGLWRGMHELSAEKPVRNRSAETDLDRSWKKAKLLNSVRLRIGLSTHVTDCIYSSRQQMAYRLFSLQLVRHTPRLRCASPSTRRRVVNLQQLYL